MERAEGQASKSPTHSTRPTSEVGVVSRSSSRRSEKASAVVEQMPGDGKELHEFDQPSGICSHCGTATPTSVGLCDTCGSNFEQSYSPDLAGQLEKINSRGPTPISEVVERLSSHGSRPASSKPGSRPGSRVTADETAESGQVGETPTHESFDIPEDEDKDVEEQRPDTAEPSSRLSMHRGSGTIASPEELAESLPLETQATAGDGTPVPEFTGGDKENNREASERDAASPVRYKEVSFDGEQGHVEKSYSSTSSGAGHGLSSVELPGSGKMTPSGGDSPVDRPGNPTPADVDIHQVSDLSYEHPHKSTQSIPPAIAEEQQPAGMSPGGMSAISNSTLSSNAPVSAYLDRTNRYIEKHIGSGGQTSAVAENLMMGRSAEKDATPIPSPGSSQYYNSNLNLNKTPGSTYSPSEKYLPYSYNSFYATNSGVKTPMSPSSLSPNRSRFAIGSSSAYRASSYDSNLGYTSHTGYVSSGRAYNGPTCKFNNYYYYYYQHRLKMYLTLFVYIFGRGFN